ncbi:MAG: monovalent cation/H(+) antiporter subunit G [Gammaproteobacteria bacterium]|nr:monovalent cation/H(+) antiporter subunit G [Gammaproteobacteria bacterium]
MTLLSSLQAIFIAVGCLFFIIGTVGLLRFPDVLTRIHALTKADNLGLGFIVIGLIPSMSSAADIAKLIVCWLLILCASSVSAFLVANQQINKSKEANNHDVV